MNRREQEQPINPEVVWGREFRVPAIVDLGSGRGFDFEGLHLPRGWEKEIPKFKEINHEKMQTFFEQYCQERDFIPGKIELDSTTGVLREITIQANPISRLYLADRFPKLQDGIYEGENVYNLQAAIILQRFAVEVLNYVWPDKLYPYIDGGERGYGYYSRNLRIPKEFLKTEIPLTNKSYQRSFEIQASNIAVRFGLTLRRIDFDERGILANFDVLEGNSCGYDLDNRRNEYHGHNVDTPRQVAVLHGIGASFINGLFKNKDGEDY